MVKPRIIIFIGSDHGGWELKNHLTAVLSELGYSIEDLSGKQYDPKDDYPQIAFSVAEAVSRTEHSFGVLLCRSGSGMVIAANKVKGARAVFAPNEIIAHHARSHNDANIITLDADWLKEEEARSIVRTFLLTPCSNAARHKRRRLQITNYEKKQ